MKDQRTSADIHQAIDYLKEQVKDERVKLKKLLDRGKIIEAGHQQAVINGMEKAIGAMYAYAGSQLLKDEGQALSHAR